MDEPLDPSTIVEPVPSPPAPPAGPTRRRWWIAGGAALVVAIAVTIALVLTLGSDGSEPRGALTARSAATGFVAAIDVGDRDRAAQLSCSAFTDQAAQFARTGADAGIDFALVSVTPGRGAGRVVITQTLRLAGKREVERIALSLTREQGRWLVCGRRQLTH